MLTNNRLKHAHNIGRIRNASWSRLKIFIATSNDYFLAKQNMTSTLKSPSANSDVQISDLNY